MLIYTRQERHTPVLFAGGEAEAQAAYDEGVNAIFGLQLDHHSHLQPYRSTSDGTARWAKVEMWPMVVRFSFVELLAWSQQLQKMPVYLPAHVVANHHALPADGKSPAFQLSFVQSPCCCTSRCCTLGTTMIMLSGS